MLGPLLDALQNYSSSSTYPGNVIIIFAMAGLISDGDQTLYRTEIPEVGGVVR